MAFNLMRYKLEKAVNKIKHYIGKLFSDSKKATEKKQIKYTKDAPAPKGVFRKKQLKGIGTGRSAWKKFQFGNCHPIKPFATRRRKLA